MNNYDQSSTGENIEFFCEYDYGLGQFYFNEFELEATRLNAGRNNSAYLVGDATKPYYKKSELKKMSKLEVFNLCEFYDLLGHSDIDRFKKSEYIEDLSAVTISRHYEMMIKEHSWHSFRDAITHDYYISRGYSQGDSVYIISLDEPLTSDKRVYFDHCLWDAPIYICATIDGVFFEADYFLNDPYEYDKDVIKQKIEALPISGYAKKWLADNLPMYPKG